MSFGLIWHIAAIVCVFLSGVVVGYNFKKRRIRNERVD